MVPIKKILCFSRKPKLERKIQTEGIHGFPENQLNFGKSDLRSYSYKVFFYYLNMFVKAFAQEQKCSSKELTLSQYICLPKSTNVVQVQCMGSDVR